MQTTSGRYPVTLDAADGVDLSRYGYRQVRYQPRDIADVVHARHYPRARVKNLGTALTAADPPLTCCAGSSAPSASKTPFTWSCLPMTRVPGSTRSPPNSPPPTRHPISPLSPPYSALSTPPSATSPWRSTDDQLRP